MWLLIADFHLHKSRLAKQNDTISWIQEISISHKPTHIIFLGDSFHSRSTVCIESQQVFLKFLQFFQSCDWSPSIHILVGNHDMAYRHDRTVNFPSLFENIDKNTFVYSEIRQLTIDGFQTVFMPYHEDQNIIATYLNSISPSNSTIVFAHIAVDGTKVNGISDNSNNICKDSGLTLNILSRYKRVFAGHFHHHAVYGNFMYVGSPMMYSFADIDQPERGCVLYDPINDTSELLVNPFSIQYYQFSYNDCIDLKDQTLSGKHIKMIIPDDINDMDIIKAENNLFSLGVANVQIVQSPKNDPIIHQSLSDVCYNIHDIVHEFVQQQTSFSDGQKSCLINMCLLWCSSIGTRLDTTRFQGKISKIVTHNFLGSKGTHTFNYHNLPVGLYYLQGENGSGKTSLHDAISYGLFGELSRNLSVNNIINNTVKKNDMWVSIHFENGYVVTRKRTKHKALLEIKTPDNTVIEKGENKSTDQALRELINIDWNTFERITMLDGRSIINYFSSKDKEKHSIIENLFGLNIQQLHELSKTDFMSVQSSISISSNQIKIDDNNLQNHILHCTNLTTDIDSEQTKIISLDDNIVSIKKRIDSHSKLQTQLELDLQDTLHLISSNSVILDLNTQNLTKESLLNHSLFTELSLRKQENEQYFRDFSMLQTDIQTHILNLIRIRNDISINRHSVHREKYRHRQLTIQRKTEKDGVEFYQNHLLKEYKNNLSSIDQAIQECDNDLKSSELSLSILSKEISHNEKIILIVQTIDSEIQDIQEKIILHTSTIHLSANQASELLIKISESKCAIHSTQTIQDSMNILNDSIASLDEQLATLANSFSQDDLKIKSDISKYQQAKLKIGSDLDDLSSQKLIQEKQLQEHLRHVRAQNDIIRNVIQLEDEKQTILDTICAAKDKHELSNIRKCAHEIASDTKMDNIIYTMKIRVEDPLDVFVESNNQLLIQEKKKLKSIHKKLETMVNNLDNPQDRNLKSIVDLENEESTNPFKQNLKITNDRIKSLQSELDSIHEHLLRNCTKQSQMLLQYSESTKDINRQKHSSSQNLSELQRSLDKLLDLQKELPSLQEQYEVCLRTKHDAQKSIDNLQETMDTLQKKRSVANADLDDSLHTKVTHFEKLTCTHKENQQRLSLLQSQSINIKDRIKSTKEEIHTRVEIIDQLDFKIKLVDQNIHVLDIEFSKLDTENIIHQDILLKKQQAIVDVDLTSLISSQNLYNESCTRKNDLSKQHHDLKIKLDLLHKKKSSISDDLKNEINTIFTLKNDIQRDIALQEDIVKRIDTLQTKQALAKSSIDLYTQTIDGNQKELDLLYKKRDDLAFWKDATSQSKGTFRQFCLQRAVKLINERLTTTLDVLNEGHSSDLNCRLNDKLVLEEVGSSILFEQRSSGEQKITLLAVIFTIMDLIIQNCGFETNILFLDEIFDALDQQAIYMVEKWISNYTTKKPFLRTFLITHTEIMSAGKSEGIIRAKKDRNTGSSYKAIHHKLGEIVFFK